MAHVYHWKHGWIPLDHVAALKKAKGNRAAAAKMLSDGTSQHSGINSRRDVAKALRDLPSVPGDERDSARRDIIAAAKKHGAEDLLPASMRGNLSAVGKVHEVNVSDVKEGDIVHVAGLKGTRRLRVKKAYGVKSDGTRNVDVVDLDTGRDLELTLDGTKPVKVERH